jgi:hypothetical protein
LEEEWRISQQWTSIEVPWSASYHETFQFTLKKPPSSDSHVVVVLSQLDDRYFRGLEGQYFFKLNFRLHSSDNLGGDDYIARSHGNSVMFRSVIAELPDMQDGTYSVVVKVAAERNQKASPVADVVEKMCHDNTDRYHEKFSQVGLSYNVAHSKGAGIMEAQIQKRKGEEKRNAWKKRHEERKRHARKYMERKRMNKAAFLIPMEPKFEKAEKTEVVRKASALKQPRLRLARHADPGPTRATTLPVMRQIDSAECSAAQAPSEMPLSTVQNIPLVQEPDEIPLSIAGNISSVEEPGEMPPPTVNNTSNAGQTTQHRATQTKVHPHPQDKGDSDQEEGSAASSEYHTDIDSVNSFGPEDEYQRLFYDPPRASRRSQERPYEEDDDDIVDPWNAVCVVGLRVYSKDPDLRIEVVMPGQGEKPGLDIDDKQAGVPVEAPPEANKELPPRRLNRSFTSPVVRKSSWPNS